jgi:tetratricopeptide (TPR) repeat protein
MDPESLRRVMGRYFDEMREVVERHGGVVEKFIGDAVMAVFGIPQVHEDDALRAVRAAAEMRERLTTLNEELERTFGVAIAVRTGVNTGEVVAVDASAGQRLVTGDAVNVAARLEQAAQPGEVLLGADTYRLVRAGVEIEPVDPLALKGKAEPVPAFRLVEVFADAVATPRHLDSPMVGREGQRALLDQAFEQVARDRVCHLFTVLGAAGVGKSRLVEEFLAGLGDRARILRGRCLSYGTGITFWPLAEALRSPAGLSDDDSSEVAVGKLAAMAGDAVDRTLIAERVAQAIGFAEGSGSPEETFWAVRKLFEAMARDRPVVLVFDDIHWAEPTLLDLIEHVTDWSRDAPILLLCLARQELLDQRTAWGGGKRSATTISLESLTDDEAEELVQNLMGRTNVPGGIGERIMEASEGNPLFVEEMVSMLVDDGVLRRQDGRWETVGDPAGVAVPPTIQALLAARLDRLQRPERAVIERASIEGKVFHRGSVTALAPDDLRPAVSTHLMALIRKELVRPDLATFSGDEAFRFRHLLIRDAAYQAMPKETRADLHERFARWLAGVAGDRITEYEEFLGYHLEQAYRYRSELGPVDDRGATLAAEAAGHLSAAGGRAADRGDLPAAGSLLSRAADVLPPRDLNRIRVMVDLAHVLLDRGEFREAERITDQALAEARDLGDRVLEAMALIPRLEIDGAVYQKDVQDILDAGEELRPILHQAGERHAELRCAMMIARHHYFLGSASRSTELQRPLLDEAQEIGDAAGENAIRSLQCGNLFWGPTPVDLAIEEVRRLVVNRTVEMRGGRVLVAMYAMQGRFDEGRELAQRLRRLAEEMGSDLWARTMPFFTGWLEDWAGDLEASIDEFRRGYEELSSMGERGYASTLAGEAGRRLVTLGRLDEARAYAEICRSTTAEDDFASQAEWRQVLARILVREGEPGEAMRLIDEAVALTEASDYLIVIASAHVDRADVLRLAGRPGDAAESLRKSLEAAERKGILPMVERIRSELAELS